MQLSGRLLSSPTQIKCSFFGIMFYPSRYECCPPEWSHKIDTTRISQPNAESYAWVNHGRTTQSGDAPEIIPNLGGKISAWSMILLQPHLGENVIYLVFQRCLGKRLDDISSGALLCGKNNVFLARFSCHHQDRKVLEFFILLDLA